MGYYAREKTTVRKSLTVATCFGERLRGAAINERQRRVLNSMLDGFEGKLTSTKWAKIGECSHDTALRDMQYLIRKGVLVKESAGGRSTSYSLQSSGSMGSDGTQ